ncbi:FAD-dependent oxidoreductase [Kribbibacterium absianum]|uniref:FAD-dependent oxidoreductase n=1 Tax=Kribbibacterium absianum TaxID=3044210 RepID=UPI0024BCBB63|nr:FAD-dependent oxidoreductase [Olsenella sp. YH-ols2216]MDJ1121223.1 FAD-dependent oxidoreductase [Olsenella sp. YH-ols2216]
MATIPMNETVVKGSGVPVPGGPAPTSAEEAGVAAVSLGTSQYGSARPAGAPACPVDDHGRLSPAAGFDGQHVPWDYQPPAPEQPRQVIIDLANLISDRIGHKVTAEDPEYYGLAACITDEMAEVALQMKVRQPKTLAQIAELTGKDPDHLLELLHAMGYAGLIEWNSENEDGKNPDHERRYVLPPFVPGSAEFFNMRRSQIDEHPEVAKMFERMTQLPLEKVTAMVPPGGAGIGMHVIPVERAISMENQTASVEHISHWLKKYEGKYAASPCSCRMSREKLGEGCADDAEDWCIGVGDMADYLVETERGRYVTYDEVLEILERAEQNGFVHQITNIDGEHKIFAICNCNVNVCNALRTSQLFNTPNMSRSAYTAKVERDKCVACGQCVEACPAGAVKLGQKLCSAETHEVPAYPRQPLPDDTPWGRHMWSPDYRDRNRIESHESGTAPCKTACPAHVPVQGYLKLAALGRYEEALALIKKENPLPAVCGRICNRRCEDACTRNRVDKAVAIDEVKRFLAERDLDPETRYIPPARVPSNRGGFDQKIAIIGAGPAGLSCAYYLAEKGYRPVVFDAHERPGGMLAYGVPSFKLDNDVLEAEVAVMEAMGVELRLGVRVGEDVTLLQLRDEGFQAFYLAIGCSVGRLPGIPGEDAQGCETAVDFLARLANPATDAPDPEPLGRVVVVGGGNVAVDAARTAARRGASEVSLWSLESADEMPATVEEVAEAVADGVSIHNGWGPVEVAVDEDGRVAAVTFKRCTQVFDETGRFSPVYDEAEKTGTDADTVVFAIGQATDWGALLDGEELELVRGRVVADPVTYQTAQPDLFVGGDVLTGPRFAIDAIAQGHEAAVSLHRFVHPGSSLTVGRNPRHYVEFDKEGAELPSYDTAGRQEPGHRADVAAHPFAEERETFTEEQVRTETARCLSCGASVVDPNKCIGCGVCTTKCAFDAIHLHRDHPEASRMVRTEDKLKAIGPYALKRGVKIAKKKLTGR